MVCPACGTENEAGRKFCGECGSPLARACPSCGTPNGPTAKFCGECGTSLTGQAAVAVAPADVPTAERRLVSVLFADLVGFTTLSESRDPEEVRELLSRYFETSRQLIARYGGVVEKFIGDAVMAVWGTPVAMEDDAERAVRAALDLVAAVAALGQEVGAADLQARAGVLTGEAAVTIGAQGQGMVAGDLVNTASRIQSAAPPGAVFVGDATRRTTEAAVVYEDAGLHELKGKAEAQQLWRAARVVAGVGGALKSIGLEAPFVGRDRELRLLKEQFHGSAEESRAHLVSVVGVAGVGKSRLGWEFFKYIDGLAGNIRWHRGRCLPYGEGVTYWALAEMVRTRAGIAEGEESASALAKLREALAENITDPEERSWIEPRLAHLLGLEERGTAGQREDLFAAWRMFYERLAEEMPTVMVFEDLQWADSALLDFLEYLQEWSRSSRLFIVTLARPELTERRPNWGTGKATTAMYLDPLPEEAMNDVLTGLVPGLPDELKAKILERAEGIPLYAVETVRMLLDRGVLVEEGGAYRPTGTVEALEVPETLHALIAARLDGLTAEERRVIQDAAVLGKTFTPGSVSALSGVPLAELDPLLSSLVKKEVLSVQADPRSPERGQYGFLQDLVKRVAYDTLSKRERKAKHLAAASTLESEWTGDEGEIVEVVASHYVEAYRAAPDAEDASEIKTRARDMLVRAGEHAGSLGANELAQHYFEQAVDLADDPIVEAEMLERAGIMARTGGRTNEAGDRFRRAIELFDGAGQTHPGARVSARLAEISWDTGRLGDAVEQMERSFRVMRSEEPDENVATVAAQLGRVLFFSGHGEAAMEPLEVALDIAEAQLLPEILSHALNTKSVVLVSRGRMKEGLALLRYALDVALENDVSTAALRAYFNLVDTLARSDRHREASELLRDGLALSRRLGQRYWEWSFLGQVYCLYCSGEWEEALSMMEELPEESLAETRQAFANFLISRPLILVHRGEDEEAKRGVDLLHDAATSADVQELQAFQLANALLLQAAGNSSDALDVAETSLESRDAVGVGNEGVKEAIVLSLEIALELGDLERAHRLLAIIDGMPPGLRPPSLHAQRLRFQGRLAVTRGDADGAESGFKGSTGLFRELEMPFPLAVTLLEYGEWLSHRDRRADAEQPLLQAREIFERLKANPWLERVDRVAPAQFVTASES